MIADSGSQPYHPKLDPVCLGFPYGTKLEKILHWIRTIHSPTMERDKVCVDCSTRMKFMQFVECMEKQSKEYPSV